MEQLKLQMEKNFSVGMMANLFHSDFKFHIKAIETLIKVSYHVISADTLKCVSIGTPLKC